MMNKRERKLPSWLKHDDVPINLNSSIDDDNIERSTTKNEPVKAPRVVEYIMSPEELSAAAVQYLKETECMSNTAS